MGSLAMWAAAAVGVVCRASQGAMATVNRWKRKAAALAQLAEDQRGKPEGDLARQKLLEIINNHPEAANYEPVRELAQRDITLGDVARMKRDGISTEGRWEGATFIEAYAAMVADYWQRIDAHEGRRYLEG